MRSSKSRGVTYIEGLFVLAILGILAVISIPRFLRAQTHARQSEAITNLKSLHAALSTQQMRPISIHVTGFDPPRGNRYSYHLNDSCMNSERRDSMQSVSDPWDTCIGTDQFTHVAFPRTFMPRQVVDPQWTSSRAIQNGLGTRAGTFSAYGIPYGWDYIAYAAGDVEYEGPNGPNWYDGADTWLISSSDGYLSRVCPASDYAEFAPAGEPFLVYDDASCN